MSVYKKNINFIYVTQIKLIYKILSINNVISTNSRKPIVSHRFNFPCLLSLKTTIHTPNKPIKNKIRKKKQQ